MWSIRSLLGLLSVSRTITGVYCAPKILAGAFEKLHKVPDNWMLVGTPDPNCLIRFRIALNSPNLAQFEQNVLEISTPSTSRYGQHMKRDEVKALLRPTELATKSVLSWLEAAGIPKSQVEDDGELVSFVTSVVQAEELFSTTFYWFRSQHNQAQIIRTLQYFIPSSLYQYIEMLQPTTRFGQIQPQRSTIHDFKVVGKAGTGLRVANTALHAFDVTSCNSEITLACLCELYDVKNFTIGPYDGNKLGIAGFLNEFAHYDDLAAFMGQYALDPENATFTIVTINDGLDTQNDTEHDSVEANLDVQYTVGMAHRVPVTYYSTPGRGPLVPDLQQPGQEANSNEPYLDFLDYVLKLPDGELPRTLTISYGEEEQSLPISYMRTVCNMFMHLGARGVSVLFSSGDSGPGNICISNDGTNTTRFQPNFPATCPWVTAVGGTYHVEPEEAASFSSGGFSSIFGRPSYQTEAVDGYLRKLGDRFSGLYEKDGRGFPDVAAQGSNYHVVDKGQDILVGGTRSALRSSYFSSPPCSSLLCPCIT